MFFQPPVGKVVGDIMCGIAGIASRNPIDDRHVLTRMRDTMIHRGPDDQGEYWACGDRVGLAQRRLSIIDLSEGGHQPMSRGHLTITYNGEIYNYRDLKRELEQEGHVFTSESDTEVILLAYLQWGRDAVEKLDGMFAFCILDERSEQLFLARDRAGEKPLFYRYQHPDFLFASELKGLMAHPSISRVLNPDALIDYLTYGYVQADKCMLEGIAKLPPGHAMTLDLKTGELDCWRYWNLPFGSHDPIFDENLLLEQMEALLDGSISRRLIADVPVGVLLSGGLDSSVVTAIASRHVSSPLKTFTVSFPGAGAYDEAAHAKEIAQHFGTEHTEIEAHQQNVDLLAQLALQYDEPLGDPSMVPTYMICKEIRRHATVALGGDGGDELFAGYFHYSWLASQARIRQVIPGFARQSVSSMAGRFMPLGFPSRNQLLGMSGDLSNCMAHVRVYFDAWSRQALFSPEMKAAIEARSTPEAERRAYADRLDKSALFAATATDFSFYLPDDVLTKVDRASMLTSLEVRAPLLDPALIDFAFAKVPDHLRATKDGRKILMKKLARRLLPDDFDVDRKQGFSIPSSWFSEQWGAYMDDILKAASPKLFDQQFIRSLQEGQKKGRKNSERLFSLVIFELWREAYNIELPF